jgi:hypothetical protein
MENLSKQIFLGVHVAAESKPFVYAVLDQKLRVLALEQGYLEELLAYASSETAMAVGINAPRHPNCGLMNQDRIRQAYAPVPPSGRWVNVRKIEYDLHRLGLRIHRTASTVEQCHDWMQAGFFLYKEIEELGSHAFGDGGEGRLLFETHGEAGFWSLLGQHLKDGTQLEGCIQRQLMLLEEGLQIPDPMEAFEEITRHRLLHGQFPFEDVFTLPQLNALLAAYTAWLAYQIPGRIQCMGDPEESELLFPLPKGNRQQ